MLAVAGVALFHSLDISHPSSMKTMTSLGKEISSNAQTNLFDTIVTDLEQGILSAEEAMGIYNLMVKSASSDHMRTWAKDVNL